MIEIDENDPGTLAYIVGLTKGRKLSKSLGCPLDAHPHPDTPQNGAIHLFECIEDAERALVEISREYPGLWEVTPVLVYRIKS